jgi:DNA-binding MarR family transcriptional regulator
MLTLEETRSLTYLELHPSASVSELARVGLARASSAELDRLLAHLNWLGYVSVYRGADEEVLLVQLTDQGRRHFGRKQTPHAGLRGPVS